MLISYNWLRELTGTSLTPLELRERLTMVGLAIDAVEEKDGDSVLDVEVPSNRPDCLSHVGIAREVAVIESGEVRSPSRKPARTEGRATDLTSVEIRDTDLCPRYAARLVRGVKIAPSPAWLTKRLEEIGQRPINNVADITNYVLHELGQPLHAFDFAKLDGKRIVVRRAAAGEKVEDPRRCGAYARRQHAGNCGCQATGCAGGDYGWRRLRNLFSDNGCIDRKRVL